MEVIVQAGSDVRFAHPLSRAFQFAVSLGLLLGTYVKVMLQKRSFLAALVNGYRKACDKYQHDYSKNNLHGFNLRGIHGFSTEGNHALL